MAVAIDQQDQQLAPPVPSSLAAACHHSLVLRKTATSVKYTPEILAKRQEISVNEQHHRQHGRANPVLVLKNHKLLATNFQVQHGSE